MNATQLPRHFVEITDAHGNRTVETRTYPVQARQPASPKPKTIETKKPEPKRAAKIVALDGTSPVAKTITVTPIEVAPAAPVQPPALKVEQPITKTAPRRVEYVVPSERTVETVMVRTGTLEKRVDYITRYGHRSWRNQGRKPRMKYRPSLAPKPLHPLELERLARVHRL